MKMAKILSLALNTGATMPAFGLGTAQSSSDETKRAVELALREGYRHLDCAHLYGNEVDIGEALQKCFREGVVKREDIFVTSKLWSDHSADGVLPACQTTLGNLQLDYLDLYLIHFPYALKSGSKTAALTDEDKLGYCPGREAKCWEAMEELCHRGLVKAIGISNYSITKTETLLKSAKIVPAVNQIECHPYLQQQKLKKYCESKGMVITAYTPLGRPGFKECVPRLLEDPVIKKIAVKHDSSTAQICIAFHLHLNTAVIPKSVTPSRIIENLKATEIKLDAEDMGRLRELDRNIRYVSGKYFICKEWGDIWDTEEDARFVIKESNCKITTQQ